MNVRYLNETSGNGLFTWLPLFCLFADKKNTENTNTANMWNKRRTTTNINPYFDAFKCGVVKFFLFSSCVYST